jgi:hypothetical protein
MCEVRFAFPALFVVRSAADYVGRWSHDRRDVFAAFAVFALSVFSVSLCLCG